MLTNDLEAVCKAAMNKADVLNNHFGKFFVRSIVAGFFIVVATILSNVTAAVLAPTYPAFGKISGAFLFAIAIILVVFIGGELFTGDNFTMAMGAYNRTTKVSDMIKVWVVSYIGNFVGAFIFSAIFVYSNASHDILVDYYKSFVYSKLSLSPMELLLRGILCNFLVCLAVYVGFKLKSEAGKLILMFTIIMTFVEAGFEHCIANMGTFSIGFLLLGDLDFAKIGVSMLFVTIGNILGGAVLLALPLKLMCYEH